MSSPFHILSLSGGGFLGLYTISVLSGLEAAGGTPLARRFDLVAGTSVGGIIALALAAEIPAATIKTAFERSGTAIFSNRPKPTTWLGTVRDLARSVHKPKHRAEALRETVIELIGKTTRLGDLKHPVIVPAVNLTKGKPQVFKTAHHKNFSTDLQLKIVDIALATAAAPTYFPIAEIGDALYADGGLFANSPDLFALHEAEYFLAQDCADVHLLSIGTTTAQFSFAHAHGQSLGTFGWWRDQRLVKVIIASQQHSVNYIVAQRLADRYLRLGADQSNEQERHLALDVATEEAQKTIRGLAAATVQAHINDSRLKRFLSHTASIPAFHHHLI